MRKIFGWMLVFLVLVLPSSGFSGATDQASGTDFRFKLREIENQVNELKQKIFRSKVGLTQLEEIIMNGAITGARAKIFHINDMGFGFKLVKASYALDGVRICCTEEELEQGDEFLVFDDPVPPGNHQVSVYLEYGGDGFGLFNYMEDYAFKLRSSHTFVAEEGKGTLVRVIGFQKGGLLRDMSERPSVRYEVELLEGKREDEARDDD